MNTSIFTFLFVSLLFLNGCQESKIGVNEIKITADVAPTVTRVQVQNNQLIVTGKNLEDVNVAKVTGGTNHTFDIESRSSSRLVLNARSALSFLVGQTLNLIVSNAEGAATFPITFELQNGQVTAAKLNNMGATAGQYLRFNGTNWAPSTLTSGQIYAGTFDAATETPDIAATTPAAGTYYIVTVPGTPNLGNGPLTLNQADLVVYNGTDWEVVSASTIGVTSFNGRTGIVTPSNGDYSWSMLTQAAGKLTGSSLETIADVDVTGIQDGDVLKWDSGTSTWIVDSDSVGTVADGSITNQKLDTGAVDSSKIADGAIVNADISATAAIDQSKIANLVDDLADKEPTITAGTNLQYYRGDKSWQTLNTTVVPEGTNYYFTDARVMSAPLPLGYTAQAAAALAPLDPLSTALGKLEGQIGAVSTAQTNYVLKAGDTMSGDLDMGGNAITNLVDPTNAQDAATKAYVDSQISSGAGDFLKDGSVAMTGTFKATDGTAGAPSITFANDQATGIYSPGTDFLGITIGGVDRATFSLDGMGNGRLGINTNPSRALHVKQEATSGVIAQFDTEAGSAIELKKTLISPQSIFLKQDVLNNFFIDDDFTATAPSLFIDGGTGNVGIQNASPGSALDVKGELRLSGATSGYVGFAPAAAAGSTTYTLPSADGSAGYVLSTDGSGVLSWIAAGGAPSGNAGGDLDGTYPNPTIAAGLDAAKIADGSVSDTEFQYLGGVTSDIQTQLDAKEGTIAAGAATEYFRGDKTWATLDTDAVDEATNLYFTDARVMSAPLPLGYTAQAAAALAPLDPLSTALGKLEGQIAAATSAQGDYVLKAGDTMGGELAMGANKITGVADPTDPQDAATMAYVDTAVATAFSPAGASGEIQFNDSGSFGADPSFFWDKLNKRLGIGTDEPSVSLHVSTGPVIVGASPSGYSSNGLIINSPSARSSISFLHSSTGQNQATDGLDISQVFANANFTLFENGYMRFLTNNTERLRIAAAGNVGINTNNPGSTLDVKGTLRLSGATSGYVGFAPAAAAGSTTYTLPTADGTSGHVLSTDGSGVLSWVAPGGAPSGNAGGDLDGTYPNPTIAAGLDAAKIADGSVSNTEFQYLGGVTSDIQTQLVAKEGTIAAGNATDYFRGDKTWAALDTDAVAEATNLYFTEPRVRDTFLGTDYAVGTAIPLTDGDTFLEAIGKLEAYIASITSNGQWTKSTNDIYYTAGKVGVGNNSPGALFHVSGTPGGSGLFKVDDTDANEWFSVGTASGLIRMNTMGGQTSVGNASVATNPNVTLVVAPTTSTRTPLGITGKAGQTGDLFRVDSSTTSSGNIFMIKASGNVGIGSASPSAKLTVNGPIVSLPEALTGASVDLSESDTYTLGTIGGSTITLSNMVNGGSYTIIVTDTTPRTYTFSGCASSKFKPANSETENGTETIYNILTVSNGGGGYNCYITWATGYQ
jgi:hypothetical protein